MEDYLAYPLGAFLKSVQTAGRDSSETLLGTLTHMAAEAMERGVDEEKVRDRFLATVPRLLGPHAWNKEEQIEAWRKMFNGLVEKLHERDAALTGHAEFEKDMGGTLIGHTDSGEEVQIKGKIDRLEVSDDGKYYIIDFKTGHKIPEDVPNHPQLKTYQTLMAKWEGPQESSLSSASPSASGKAGDSSVDNCLAGAELIYPHKKPRKRPVQAPLTNEDIDSWTRKLIELATVMAGPQFAGRFDLGRDEKNRFGSLGSVLIGKSVLDPTFTPSNPEDTD